MSLSIYKTINLTPMEHQEFIDWREGFDERAGSAAAECNFRRALIRRYGYPDYRITSDTDVHILHLGRCG